MIIFTRTKMDSYFATVSCFDLWIKELFLENISIRNKMSRETNKEIKKFIFFSRVKIHAYFDLGSISLTLQNMKLKNYYLEIPRNI